jgi:RND superfamily putative drug exporter
VFLDAIVVRCMLLPAVLELLGPLTWKLPAGLASRLPDFNIEGRSPGRPPPESEPIKFYEEERETVLRS